MSSLRSSQIDDWSFMTAPSVRLWSCLATYKSDRNDLCTFGSLVQVGPTWLSSLPWRLRKPSLSQKSVMSCLSSNYTVCSMQVAASPENTYLCHLDVFTEPCQGLFLLSEHSRHFRPCTKMASSESYAMSNQRRIRGGNTHEGQPAEGMLSSRKLICRGRELIGLESVEGPRYKVFQKKKKAIPAALHLAIRSVAWRLRKPKDLRNWGVALPMTLSLLAPSVYRAVAYSP